MYRVLFSKPISYHLIFDYDLANLTVIKQAAVDISHLLKKLVEKGELDLYWKRFDALTPSSLVKVLYTEDVIKAIRLKIKKNSGINFDQADVLNAIHELVLHECASAVKPRMLK